MGQLIRQIKKKNGLIRRFAEEEDAVGVVVTIPFAMRTPPARMTFT